MSDNKFRIQQYASVIKDRSLANKAAEIIRNMIIKGECPSGSRITEIEFAQTLDVSRISIREAFSELESEGLIKRVINKYTEIVRFDDDDIEEIYRLRTAIEIACIETCLEKNIVPTAKMREQVVKINEIAASKDQDRIIDWVHEDLRFHELLIIESGNKRALKIWYGLKNQLKTLLYATLMKYPDAIKLERSNSHNILVDYLAKGDNQNAIKNMKTHIMGGYREVIETLKKNNS